MIQIRKETNIEQKRSIRMILDRNENKGDRFVKEKFIP